jgi:preprotein translocase subunit SecY
MKQDLARRIAWTIGALLVYRLGSYIPLPGIDPVAWVTISGTGVVGAIAVLSGVRRISILALDIVPYISAAVIVQTATIVSRRVRAVSRAGEQGRVRMVRAARYLTVLLTVFQAWSIGGALEQVSGVVAHPGPLFVLSTVVTMTGGTLFLAWLAEVITVRGIGNGIVLILFTGTVVHVPEGVAITWELARGGTWSTQMVGVLLMVVVAVTALVVVMELTRRRLPIEFAGRQAGARTLDAQVSDLSVKLNPAGIVPVLLAAFVLTMLVTLGSLFIGFDSVLVAQIRPGGPSRLIVWAVLIVLCTFFYTASVLDPEEAAERFKGLGGAIPGVPPGEETAAYLDRIVSRTTILGAVYLVLVMLLPELLIQFAHVPFYFGGTGLLIAVCTVIDLITELRVRNSAPARP